MKEKLTVEQNSQIESRILQFEQNTGCELVVAIAKQSDPYPAAPLRFAVLTTLILSLLATQLLHFHFDVLLVIGQLAFIILLLPVGNIHWIKRQILFEDEVQREVNEKSLETFHNYCTTKTEHKVSTLLYISLLEHELRLLVDSDLNQKVTSTHLQQIVEQLADEIKHKKFTEGVIHAIDRIEQMVLTSFGGKVNQIAPDQIQNPIHWLEY